MAINPKILNPGEEIVVSTRTHPKALLLPILLLVVLLAVGVAVQVLVDNGTAQLVAWGLVVLAILWWVGRPVLVWLSASYTVTNRRIITRHGVITRRGHDIPLSRISDVAYERDLVDRMLGCGTLVISDASTHGSVEIYDIPRVEETHRQLQQLLHRLYGGESAAHEGH